MRGEGGACLRRNSSSLQAWQWVPGGFSSSSEAGGWLEPWIALHLGGDGGQIWGLCVRQKALTRVDHCLRPRELT